MEEREFYKQALLEGLTSRGVDEEDNQEIYVSSFNDACILLGRKLHPEGAEYRHKLVDYIVNPDNAVLGDCDVIHNFIMDLFRAGDHALAIKVCDYALKMAPYNRDIIGDAMKACGDSSQFTLGEEYLKIANEIDKTLWSYRMFLYGVDFLHSKLKAFPADKQLYERTLDLVEEYIQYFPEDEHGYNQKSELLVSMNQRDEAIEWLKRVIKEIQPNPRDARSELVAAQCCVTLLNLLDESNDYKSIIEICDKGLKNTTMEQPSARIGFFMYRRALALDARAHEEEFRAPATVTDALTCYQTAYDLNQDRAYARTIEERYAVLRPHALNFTPLIKRALYVEGSDS